MKLPLEVFLSYTTKCNLRCKHCYSSSGTGGKRINEEEILKILTQIKPLRLIISGGDPLIEFDQFISFLNRLKKDYNLDPYIVLATNGTLITEKRLEILDQFIDRFQISLDTLSREKFIGLRGVDLLDQTIKGIKRVLEKGLDMQIAFCLFKQNLDEIEEVVNFCLKNQIKRINVLRQRPLGRSDADLTREEIKWAYEEFLKHTKNKDIKLIIHDPIANFSGIQSECSAAKETVAIDTEGRFKPCPLFDLAISGDFQDIWNNNKTFRKIRKNPKECGGCEVKFCKGGCKACSFNLYGKLGKDPWCLKC